MIVSDQKPGKAFERQWPDDLGQPIVVPFRGMPEEITPPTPTEPETLEPGFTERLQKLVQIADYYGIDRAGGPGWGLLLAFRLAVDLHPGFQLVYDDWKARSFKTLYGFVPGHPLKEGDRPPHRPSGTGWAPLLSPEFVALAVSVFGRRPKAKNQKFTDKTFCELLVVSFDPDLEKLSRGPEKKRRIATLMRRLSKGRRLRMMAGSK